MGDFLVEFGTDVGERAEEGFEDFDRADAGVLVDINEELESFEGLGRGESGERGFEGESEGAVSFEA